MCNCGYIGNGVSAYISRRYEEKEIGSWIGSSYAWE
jgi:hypothetical protein